ncbi:MAG: RodZ domain-containing protein [Nitrospirota bacterium]
MVGDVLRKRREELGLDLRRISETLKIKCDYLKAIEEEAHERLPADVYVKGYIHEYARILDLDPDATLRSYAEERSSRKTEQTTAGEEASSRKKFKTAYILVPLALLFVFIIAVMVLPLPEKTSKIGAPDVLPPAPEPEVETQAKPESAGISPHMLEIHANDTTWLLVKIDNTDTRELLLQPGESVNMQAKSGFSLRIGNAAGVRLVFDGQEIGRLGEEGQVIKIDLPEAKT